MIQQPHQQINKLLTFFIENLNILNKEKEKEKEKKDKPSKIKRDDINTNSGLLTLGIG